MIVDFLFISLCDLCVCYLCFVLFFCSKQLHDGLLKVICCTSCIVSCVLDRDDEVAHCNCCASMFGLCAMSRFDPQVETEFLILGC